LLQAFQSSYVQKQINLNIGNGSTVSNLRLPIIRKLDIPSFTKIERIKISNTLSVWDKAVETVEKLITNSQQQKKALMQQLLTGKKRLPGFNENWKKVRLQRLLKEEKSRNKDSSIE